MTSQASFSVHSICPWSRTSRWTSGAAGTAAITVLLLRTGMGIAEVPEARQTIQLWAGAVSHPSPGDQLRWRQRTGYEFRYLLTTEADRAEILQRLLCAFWNGKATAVGPQTSPERVNFTLGGVTMMLPLRSIGQASSWASLLSAYESWALSDDDLRRPFFSQLTDELPRESDGRPTAPSELYLAIRNMAEGEIRLLEELLARGEPEQRSLATHMHSFWVTTLPSALELELSGLTSVAHNLRELELETIANGDQF